MLRLITHSGRLTVVSAGFAGACLTTAPTLEAQTRRGPVRLRAGVALGLARTSVAGETSTDIGPLLTGQLGVAVSSRTDLTLALVVQPFKAQNPVADEAYTGVYSLAGLQLGLGSQRRFYLRPELGLVFRSWSGSQVESSARRGASPNTLKASSLAPPTSKPPPTATNPAPQWVRGLGGEDPR